MNNSGQLFTYQSMQNNISIQVQPFFVPERSLPARNIYFFAYTVTISNLKVEAITLLRRHWIIRNGYGEEERIEGDGVVGKTPRILPEATFQYASFCPLNTKTGNMRGKYLFATESGQRIWIRIPVFFFRLPENYKTEKGTAKYKKVSKSSQLLGVEE